MSSENVQSCRCETCIRHASEVPEGQVFGHDQSLEAVRAKSEAGQKLVDETVEGARTLSDLVVSLQVSGFRPDEARDFIDAAKRRLEIRQAKAREEPDVSRPCSPSVPPEHSKGPDRSATLPVQGPDFQSSSHAQAIESAAWASLLDQVDPSRKDARMDQPTRFDIQNAGFESKDSEVAAIPPSLLAIAPHLASFQDEASFDPHLAKTWELRQEYGKEKVIDSLVNLAQLKKLKDPISRSIWRLIILDHYVDFEKLYATLDKGYDYNDEPKDFIGGFSIIKKDHATARRPILSESDWARVFDAWADGVISFYPHRKIELAFYRGRIVDFIRSSLGAVSMAINFDADTRNRYARNPFRLNDPNELHIPLLSQLIGVSAAASHPTLGTKRTSFFRFTPNKRRASTICQNWNLGYCNVDPCSNNRRHGVCCECGNKHRARDNEECLSKLRARRQSHRATGGLEA